MGNAAEHGREAAGFPRAAPCVSSAGVFNHESYEVDALKNQLCGSRSCLSFKLRRLLVSRRIYVAKL